MKEIIGIILLFMIGTILMEDLRIIRLEKEVFKNVKDNIKK